MKLKLNTMYGVAADCNSYFIPMMFNVQDDEYQIINIHMGLDMISLSHHHISETEVELNCRTLTDVDIPNLNSMISLGIQYDLCRETLKNIPTFLSELSRVVNIPEETINIGMMQSPYLLKAIKKLRKE